MKTLATEEIDNLIATLKQLVKQPSALLDAFIEYISYIVDDSDNENTNFASVALSLAIENDIVNECLTEIAEDLITKFTKKVITKLTQKGALLSCKKVSKSVKKG